MIDRLARNPGSVYLLLAIYFAINVLLRMAAPASLELDEAQQLFLTQWLAVGYDSQPPFYNWLQYGVVQLLGDTVLALSLLKNVMLFFCYLLFGLTARLVVRDRKLAIIATLGLLTIPVVSYGAQRDLTHTVGLLFAACMFMHFFIRALQRPTTLNYALTGVALGIGILSKYNFVLLPFAAVMSVLPENQWRARLFNPRIFLTTAIAAAILAPHAIWFMDHVPEATGRTLGKLTTDAGGDGIQQLGNGMLSLAVAVAGVALPTLLIFLIAFGRGLLDSWKAENRWTRLFGRMFLILIAVLALVVLVGEASSMRDRWLIPLFFLFPIYLCAKLEASGAERTAASHRFGVIVLAIMVMVPLVLGARPYLGSLGLDGKQNVPYGPAITAILATKSDRPSLILAGDQQLAGNVRLHTSDIAVTAPDYERFQEPYIFDANHPVLVIWRSRNGKPMAKPLDELQSWLNEASGVPAGQIEGHDIAMPYHHGREGEFYHFSYAWIYPDASNRNSSRTD